MAKKNFDEILTELDEKLQKMEEKKRKVLQEKRAFEKQETDKRNAFLVEEMEKACSRKLDDNVLSAVTGYLRNAIASGELIFVDNERSDDGGLRGYPLNE